MGNTNAEPAASGFFKRERNWLLPFMLIAVLVLINYAGMLRAEFVYDDHYWIVENPNIRSVANIPSFFSDPVSWSLAEPNRHQYRPLRGGLWALLYAIWGLNPAPYHAVNIVFHILNSMLVFLLFSRIFSRSGPALVGALIFAAHPAMTEVVCWISCLDNLLCSFFYLLGLLCYLRAEEESESNGLRLYVASGIAMILALLSKEMAITFPIAIVAIAVWRSGLESLSPKRIATYVPFVVAAIAYLLLRSHLLGRVSQANVGWSATPSVITAIIGREFAYYCRLLLFPFRLTVFPAVSVEPLFHDALAILALAIVILLLSAAVMFRRLAPRASLGVVLFFVFLLPVSNIIPILSIVAERYAYLPIVGFLLPVSAAWQAFEAAPSRSLSDRRRNALAAAAIAGLLFVLSINTIRRGIDWQSDLALFRSEVEIAPDNARPHVSLGRQYLLKGDYERAEYECLLALRLDPTDPRPHTVLGTMYLQRGFMDRAEKEFQAALRLDPLDHDASNGLGLACRSQGKLDEALVAFQAAARSFPNPTFLNNVGAVLLEKGEFAEALDYFSEALRMSPLNKESAFNKAYALFRLGRSEEAVRSIEEYLEQNPDAPEMKALLNGFRSSAPD